MFTVDLVEKHGLYKIAELKLQEAVARFNGIYCQQHLEGHRFLIAAQ